MRDVGGGALRGAGLAVEQHRVAGLEEEGGEVGGKVRESKGVVGLPTPLSFISSFFLPLLLSFSFFFLFFVAILKRVTAVTGERGREPRLIY